MDCGFIAKTSKSGCGRVIKITSWEPFSKGANKYAFKGKIMEGPNHGQEAVVKVFIDKNRRSDPTHISADIKAQKIAKEFAEKFSKRLGNPERLKFRESEQVKIVKTYHDSPYFKVGDYVAVERLITYGWKMWSNCFGGQCIPSRTLAAFEHFVYYESGGKRMVCDLQGGTKDHKYALTDPTLSSVIDHGLHLNGGKEVIEKVWRRHKCNEVCEHLGLKKK